MTMLTGTKPWWQSRAILGALVSLVATFAGALGLVIAPEVQADIVTALMVLAGALGSALSIYGRIRADSRIGPKGNGTSRGSGSGSSSSSSGLLSIFALTALLGLTLTMGACTGPVGAGGNRTQAQQVYALQADYLALQTLAAAYVSQPDASSEASRKIRALDAAAWKALQTAYGMARTEQAGLSAALALAQGSVTALSTYLAQQSLSPQEAVQ